MALPLLVIGPIGCGKTHVINCVSRMSHNRLVSYQLSNETDAACLIGGYVQRDDGQFEWRQGPLAQAAVDGSWVLLEDVDQDTVQQY